jgi:hypothetical protein
MQKGLCKHSLQLGGDDNLEISHIEEEHLVLPDEFDRSMIR